MPLLPPRQGQLAMPQRPVMWQQAHGRKLAEHLDCKDVGLHRAIRVPHLCRSHSRHRHLHAAATACSRFSAAMRRNAAPCTLARRMPHDSFPHALAGLHWLDCKVRNSLSTVGMNRSRLCRQALPLGFSARSIQRCIWPPMWRHLAGSPQSISPALVSCRAGNSAQSLEPSGRQRSFMHPQVGQRLAVTHLETRACICSR